MKKNLEDSKQLDKAIRSAPPAKAPPGASVDPVTPPLPARNPDEPRKPEPALPRFEFGSTSDDFQLRQAINHLKGQPVVASIRANTAAATQPAQVTAQPKADTK